MTFWEIVTKYTVKIPSIQRDYAQGRTGEESLAREFLKYIKGSLLDNKNLNLDFIYGEVKEGKLILLDGQQRMTTLFLLHWYLSLGNMDDEKKNILSKFKYATRPNSEDFCFRLVMEGLDKLSGNKVRDRITKSKWFYLSWEKDPTVSAMLNMLDLIDDTFKAPDAGLFNKLIGKECPIVFDFLDLGEFGLTNDLYIKMNARGKPLTKFENLKAKISECFDDDSKDKLDNGWLDIFWDMEKNGEQISVADIDKLYYQFFVNITLCFYLENKNIDKIERFDVFETYKEIYNKPEYAGNVQRILDALIPFDDNDGYFAKFIKPENYWDRTRFYAIACFFIQYGKINDDNRPIFRRWMRVCKNLINNTAIDSPDNYANAIRSIKNLSRNIKFIYEYFSASKPIDFFNRSQVDEERIKSTLILSDAGIWEEPIIKIEEHPYFDGQIGFILNFSKSGEDYNIKFFLDYSRKLSKLFTEFRDEHDCIFQKALLAYGDYSVDINSAKTFCSFDNSLRAKTDNWRKVFNDPAKSCYLKQLLDYIDTDGIAKGLQNLIDNYNTDDWKRLFIRIPSVLSACSNYQIKIGKTTTELAKSAAAYWRKRAELYTFAYFTRYWKDKNVDIKPFIKIEYYYSAYDAPPCLGVDGWVYGKYNFSLDIFYDDEKGFWIDIFDQNENEIPPEVDSILKDNGFEKNNSGKRDKLQLGKMDFENLNQKIHKILRRLMAV
jgi:hypothetical protein